MPDDALDTAQQAAVDAAAREHALDTRRSFLVQAPAGSGKTELLIQRFLALLATVERPEAIVAMTFTRKAAGEMRERIVAALRDAAQDRPVVGAHAARTRALARSALVRDAACGWQLVVHPARLRLVTIDAIATGLAREAPLTTRTGGMPAFREHPQALFRAAASEALADAATDDPAWRALLDHLDNDGERAVELLAHLLGRRDQWLRHLVGADPAGLRSALEATLVREIEAGLAAAHALFPAVAAHRLGALARYALGHLTGEGADAQLQRALDACLKRGGMPGASCVELADWQALAHWMLVKDDAAWRKAFTRNQGFPPKGSGGMAREREERKDEMLALLAELDAVPGLAQALHAVRNLPPACYADAAWEVIAALLTVLPRVAAMLKLQFAREHAIDFSEATQLALLALGTPDAPSDILLALDQRIEHLLVDEFQDTSLMQRDLILRLTAGWTEGDGRTLFAVGDPMQSIYRFREAEVSLFLAAQQERRLGEVTLEAIILARNFRSQAGIVEWVNAVFARVLPALDDPVRGAVRFRPSVATHPAREGDGVTLDLAMSEDDEAIQVVARVRDALTQTTGDVAILVRARSHLLAILPALRAAGIAFQAVELDRLTERAAVRDLLALTHALLQPADRLAWLAVLRAPWCGLTLADLLVLADHGPILWQAIGDEAGTAQLSADGRVRLARVATILSRVMLDRGRLALPLALRGAWLALGGPATLTEASDLEAAERYFGLLAEHAQAGDVPDWGAFVAAVEALHAEADVDAPARVQVMTLHKAKGLQFGTVILAALARKMPHPDRPLLQWRVRPSGLMLAPIRGRAEAQEDAVYGYLMRLHADEEAAERGRLLYVGATRAKERLHLSACLATRQDEDGRTAWRAPVAGSLLARLWPALQPQAPPPPGHDARGASLGVDSRLLRLPVDWRLPPPPTAVALLPGAPAPVDTTVVFDWARETARHIGIVAHRLLARIAQEGLEAWPVARSAGLRPWLRAELIASGVDRPELDAATAGVEAALARTLTDARGRWLFDAAHTDARSEWALAGIEGEALVHVVLDRTFVCAGERWIVDFKTGVHEGTGRDAFLDAEQARYAAQLERYARLVRSLDPRPIRLALYHPLEGGWREWGFED